ncbi:hypothetical protein [Streptomyces sp. CC228A]|uniref:hypothetical protein n=1 Tax=Streptomyces sp. CC228A TaxID=2898186 RepID=UPI001F43ADEA|nr:hypothetical protein [Streptomyces sp. CC228A]
MATQPTDLPGQAGFTSSIPLIPTPALSPLSAQLRGYMAALSAAEHVLSSSPVLPASVSVERASWAESPIVRVYFHYDPEAVRVFAERFGCAVSVEERGRSVYTAATGVVCGVRFEAWALTPAEAVAE